MHYGICANRLFEPIADNAIKQGSIRGLGSPLYICGVSSSYFNLQYPQWFCVISDLRSWWSEESGCVYTQLYFCTTSSSLPCCVTYICCFSIALPKRNFTLKYDTNIPRQVVSKLTLMIKLIAIIMIMIICIIAFFNTCQKEMYLYSTSSPSAIELV